MLLRRGINFTELTMFHPKTVHTFRPNGGGKNWDIESGSWKQFK